MERFVIPDIEFKERAKKLQAEMKKNGVELLLAYGNEAEPQYVRYLSNYWPSFETAGVLVTQEGDPALLIGPESYTYAKDRSKIDEIRLLKAFRESSDPEYPGKPLDTFAGLIKERFGNYVPENRCKSSCKSRRIIHRRKHRKRPSFERSSNNQNGKRTQMPENRGRDNEKDL